MGKVGESRALIVDNTQAERISYDHKASDLSEQKRI